MTFTAPPRIFDSKGNFIEDVDTTGLDATSLALLENVRTESRAVKAAEQAMADAIAEQSAAKSAVKNTTEYHDAHYPPQSFHALWLETFGTRQEQERARGR